ncbi:uncharacterized protein ACIBXB_003018 [Morphnus guianensis]
MQGGAQACVCCSLMCNAGDEQVSTLQCLADCRYNNHFTHHRAGTTLGKAMAAVKQHIRNRCSNSKDREGIFEAGKNQADLTYTAAGNEHAEPLMVEDAENILNSNKKMLS